MHCVCIHVILVHEPFTTFWADVIKSMLVLEQVQLKLYLVAKVLLQLVLYTLFCQTFDDDSENILDIKLIRNTAIYHITIYECLEDFKSFRKIQNEMLNHTSAVKSNINISLILCHVVED